MPDQMPIDWFVDHSRETDLWVCGMDPEYPDERIVIAEIQEDIGDTDSEDREVRQRIARLIAAAPALLAACRDQAAWIERLLQMLEHRTTCDQRGNPVNSFAFAAVPDWDLRQKLESLREDVARASKGVE
jgi:hypothetical protein